MIRNLVLGFREAEAFCGVMRVGYLPDAFGHVSQLVRGFGIEDIVARRGVPLGTKLAFEMVGADSTLSMFIYLYRAYGNALGLPLFDEKRIEYIDSTPFESPGFSDRLSAADLEPRATTPYLLLMNGVDHTFAQTDLPANTDKVNRTRGHVRVRSDRHR
jgi:mannosylglycerate hydrolase